jgi:hypothetical protein
MEALTDRIMDDARRGDRAAVEQALAAPEMKGMAAGFTVAQQQDVQLLLDGQAEQLLHYAKANGATPETLKWLQERLEETRPTVE